MKWKGLGVYLWRNAADQAGGQMHEQANRNGLSTAVLGLFARLWRASSRFFSDT